ncbi:ECF transporter S component [Clostridium felsineum]|uniref:ECF transporter S component n=1 Tax=Clostridium felsineum TaxID=36839 RepID=UPI00098BE6B4|nr:ECF transporter S component [Clostridium felsineum]URZ03784.1 Riboflavin transporter RibU [Clostridium felsineum]
MKNSKLSTLIKISLLSVIGFILMFIELPIPIFPSFLKIDISDLPALLGAFAMGPIAGIIIELVKNVLHLLRTQTAGTGELANFIVGSMLVLVSGAMYKHKKTKTNAVISLSAGVIVMSVVASVLNYFIFLPLYETLLHFPIKEIVKTGHAINSSINDLNSFVVYSILPFNLIKGVVISVLTMVMYKRVSPMLHRETEKLGNKKVETMLK